MLEKNLKPLSKLRAIRYVEIQYRYGCDILKLFFNLQLVNVEI